MQREIMQSRRCFLRHGAAAAGALALSGGAALAAHAEKETGPLFIYATEDLMREHGVLRRIMLIYDAAAGRLETGQGLPGDILPQTTDMVHRFVNEYHERLEEEHLFPRFRKAGKEVELVNVLLEQHEAGRRLTPMILAAAKEKNPPPPLRQQLARQLRQFNAMYAPHAAREDTVLFPAFHSLVNEKEYARISDFFEDTEEVKFGDDAIEKFTAQLAEMEKALGIHDLRQFTVNA